MPYVRSYYRRSAGFGSGGGGALRPLSVAVYDAAGNALRCRAAGPADISDLSFGTQLPGGFSSCVFVVHGRAAAQWALDTGQRVVVQRGSSVVWWGWIEDVERGVQGGIKAVRVSALGPYQQLRQRLITSFVGAVSGEYALKAMLQQYCNEISGYHGKIQSTGVDLEALYKEYWAVADLVDLVCETGNSLNQTMLFAIWEPLQVGETASANLCPNPSFETPDPIDGALYADEWDMSLWQRSSAYAQYGAWSVSAAAASRLELEDGSRIAALASTTYVLSFWHRRPSGTRTFNFVGVECFNSGGDLLSTITLTSSLTPGTSWNQTVYTLTTPASTASVDLNFQVDSGTGTVYLDDVEFRQAAVGNWRAKPVAHLWAKELTGYDYLLWTSRLETTLTARETTSDLANAVLVGYGEGKYTPYAEDATSQGLYRRRDVSLAAGNDVGENLAQAIRDTYLAAHKYPRDEASQFSVAQRLKAITNLRHAPIDLALVRAGDRLRIADGPLAGTVMLLSGTTWNADVLQCEPEARITTPRLLAKIDV